MTRVSAETKAIFVKESFPGLTRKVRDVFLGKFKLDLYLGGFMFDRLCVAFLVIFFAFSPVMAQDNANSVRVQPIDLNELRERLNSGLDLCAVVSDPLMAEGIQEAADIWGLHVDLFVLDSQKAREDTLLELAESSPAALIYEGLEDEQEQNLRVKLKSLEASGRLSSRIPIIGFSDSTLATKVVREPHNSYTAGFESVKAARAELLPLIPKYDELLPIGFPISPVPDSFFQPTKFPYPDPLVRSPRTVASTSASAHAHTSCPSYARLGNMLHRTSDEVDDVFLVGFEGGNLSAKAEPGAVSDDKLASIMTSYVLAVRGNQGERRTLISENDGLPTSFFSPAIHAPEELRRLLEEARLRGEIEGFSFRGSDEIDITGWQGKDRRFRAAFFIVSAEKNAPGPNLVPGIDAFGRQTFEFTSSQRFQQLFCEITEPAALRAPRGGLLNQSGTFVNVIGLPLGVTLKKVSDGPEAPFQPYILGVEGGFLVVTPVGEITENDLSSKITRVYIDERGPLASVQKVKVSLSNGRELDFRRTALSFSSLDTALSTVKEQAWISDWEFVGARGQGLAANVVLHDFFGKHRKFMSSLNTWPSHDRPKKAYIRWYVDGMQRLNFSLVTPEGWRQEFVEVPLKIPPIPRDVELFTGISSLD